MSLSGVSGLVFKSIAFARVAKVSGGGLLSLAILVWVADHSGPPNGQVIVHVMESDVTLTIGGNTYQIEALRYAPIVCTLPRGRHELILSRGSQVLYRESFELRGGESLILNAWDPPTPP